MTNSKCFFRRTVGTLLILAAGTWGAMPWSAEAADYRGADAVLTQALNTNGSSGAKQEAPSPNEQLREDLKKFGQSSATLAPAEAARQWLVLVDRLVKLQESPPSFNPRNRAARPVEAEALLAALPPPAAWAELAKAVEARPAGTGVEARRQLGLRLLAHTLAGDTAKRKDDLAALQLLATKAKTTEAYVFNSVFEQLSRSLWASLDNPDALLQSLEQRIAVPESAERYGGRGVEIPDLVTLVGPQKAEAFLRKALVQSESQLSIEADSATQKLAAKLALELIQQLKKPQWSLVNSLDSVELYEALDKRFKQPEPPAVSPGIPGIPQMVNMRMPGEDGRENARIFYFLGLIAVGRTTNAVAVAREFEKEDYVNFPSDVLKQMERAGFTKQLSAFFHELLQQNPELPFWEEYVQTAAQAGDTADMVNLVKATLAQNTLSRGARARLQQLMYAALLANDNVEDGVAELQKLLSPQDEQAGPGGTRAQSRGVLALQLARIGQLLNRTTWTEAGIAAAKAAIQKEGEQENSYFGNSTAVSLAKFLEKIIRGPEAEEVLASALADTVRNKTGGVEPVFPGQPTPATPILLALVRLYHEAGRDADVLLLFDRAPGWGAGDLAQVNTGYGDMEEFSMHGKHVTVPTGYYAAAALAATGRTAEASKLLDPLFDESPGSDRLYEILFKVDEEHAPARLDALFARDQFEERPLIWKAHWLRTHGRPEDAEKCARQAIAIDPSDGEEGPGDRLRAYAELAEIRAARGDTNEAATMRGAVAAIRGSETADQFQEAGLLKRAVAMYEDSLKHFADAYCIHARLAVQFSDLGMHKEAEEHYRRAYELMPVSFGRVESHCFGCERAFDGQRAQSIAEQVFTKLAKETPDKPQVHYLLGYLREEEARYNEALESYRMAVKLDPEYLNAWIRFSGISEHVYLPAAERDAVVFNILRLDPAHRQGGQSYALVSDLAGLWKAVAEANARRPAKPDSLYPLPASKAEMEKRKTNSNAQERDMMEQYTVSMLDREGKTTPGEAVAQNGFVRAAGQLFGSQGSDAAFW